MIEMLLRAVFETVVSTIIEALGLTEIVEIVTAIAGLAFMAIGLVVYLSGGFS